MVAMPRYEIACLMDTMRYKRHRERASERARERAREKQRACDKRTDRKPPSYVLVAILKC